MPQNNTSTSSYTSPWQKGLSRIVTIYQKKPFILYICLFLGTGLLYLPTMNAGFVTDVTGGIERIQNQPFQNVLHSFGFPALNQLSVLGFYLLYKGFGTFGLPWFLIFCSLHALNAFLAFALFKRLFEVFRLKNAMKIAFIGAFLFLIHPYQTEVLVWRACLNYLLVTAFLLTSLFYLIQFLQTKKSNYLNLVHGFFILALFTFELALMLPLLALCFYSIWCWHFQQRLHFLSFFYKISIPQFLLSIGYFGLHKFIFGNWIGHYGASTHLQFSPLKMMGTLVNYVLKHTFFVRSYSHTYKEKLFSLGGQYGWVFCLVILGAILFLFFYKKTNNHTPSKKLILLLIASFGITLLPVLNLFFYWIQWVENDRYGYLPSVFGMMLLVLLLFQLPTIIRYFLLLVCLLTSIGLLVKTNQYWKISTEVYQSLLADYRWQEAENVVILNIPDNYNGVYLFRIIGRGSGLKDALTTIKQQKISGKIWEVAQYNMVRPTDGISVKMNTPNQLNIEFNQWGNWFWRNGVGVGKTHKRSIYTAHFQGNGYRLDLKNPPANTIFIYQDGKKWKEWLPKK